VLGHLTLHVDERPGRVEPNGQEDLGGFEALSVQVRRCDRHGDGVQVDDAIDGLVLVLEPYPVSERPEIVADVHVARRLDAGEHLVFLLTHPSLR
jgi:hypothetical protein